MATLSAFESVVEMRRALAQLLEKRVRHRRPPVTAEFRHFNANEREAALAWLRA